MLEYPSARRGVEIKCPSRYSDEQRDLPPMHTRDHISRDAQLPIIRFEGVPGTGITIEVLRWFSIGDLGFSILRRLPVPEHRA
jgi:hypothetical protein